MAHIFSRLALFALAFNTATLVMGFQLDEELRTSELRIHFLFGLFSALLVMLVQGVVVTYFIGTTRWCKEVSETYSLDPSLVRRSTVLKRRTFPLAVLCMLGIIAVAALGAASDPHNTLVENTDAWATPHLLAAITGFCLLAVAFYFEWYNIGEHHRVIEDVLAEVKRIRTERGLPD